MNSSANLTSSTKNPINKPLIDQLRGLYAEINVLGAPDSAITGEYSLGYNHAIDRVLRILGASGFEEGKSTAADEIEHLQERSKEIMSQLQLAQTQLSAPIVRFID